MKISLHWLSDYIELKDYWQDPEELGELLTRAGLEVEDMQRPGKDFHHVVIGCVLEKSKHPNADKLSLCRVTTGEGLIHQIVCGAQNHKTGDRVVVALPGAVLPGAFAIKKSEIRGVESLGMLCSYKELGISPVIAEGVPPSASGIIILPAEAPIGKPYAEYAGLDDVIFDLKVTPNRADCLSHYGLAREISALLKRPLIKIHPKPKLSGPKASPDFKVEVKAKDLCPRYMGRLIRKIKVGPSPDWLKQRLEKLGMSSINNIVDVTNYVLMELGQPLHAFDSAQIANGHLIIDRARAEEKFLSLDGTPLILKDQDLTIRDAERPLCLAGTIGGKNSGVTEATTDIFLESAFFVANSVRKTSRSHGIETESSYRFSRGVDSRAVDLALERATELILQVAGGEASSDRFDIVSSLSEAPWISITSELIGSRLGYAVPMARAIDFFQRLGCEVKTAPSDQSQSETTIIEVKPPSFRFDLEQEMDLVEEYARMQGYDQIPETLPANSEIPSGHDPIFDWGRRIGGTLRKVGFSQAWNFAFTKDSEEDTFLGDLDRLSGAGLSMGAERVRVVNPLNDDLNTLRRSLSHGLVQNVKLNSHRGNEWGRFYELGMTFAKNSGDLKKTVGTGGDSAAKARNLSPYEERWRLGIVSWGFLKSLWDQRPRSPLVFEIKGAFEHLLEGLGIQDYHWTNGEFSQAPRFLHGGQWAELWVRKQKVGFIGTLHPQILEQEKIRESVALGEIDLAFCLISEVPRIQSQAISKFPSVERDFSFLVPMSLPAEKVAKVIEAAAGPLCLGVQVFDVYLGNELPKGHRSIAFSMKLQSQDATMQDIEIQKIHEQVLGAVREKFGLAPR